MKAKKIEENVFILENNGELFGLLYKDDDKVVFLNKTDRKELPTIKELETHLGEKIVFQKLKENVKDNNFVGKFPIKHNIIDVEILEENEMPYYKYKDETYFAGYHIVNSDGFKIVFCPSQEELSAVQGYGVYTSKDKAEMEMKLLVK